MSALLPAESYRESGRWEVFGARCSDRTETTEISALGIPMKKFYRDSETRCTFLWPAVNSIPDTNQIS